MSSWFTEGGGAGIRLGGGGLRLKGAFQAASSTWLTNDSCRTNVTGFLELLKLLQAGEADAA